MYLNQQLRDFPCGFSIVLVALAWDSSSRGATGHPGRTCLEKPSSNLVMDLGGDWEGGLIQAEGEEMGQVSLLSSVALSFFPGGGKTQKPGKTAEGRPALGP